MIITEDLFEIESFTSDEVVAMLNNAFIKCEHSKPGTEFFTARWVIKAFTEQVVYHLHGMVLEAAEELTE